MWILKNSKDLLDNLKSRSFSSVTKQDIKTASRPTITREDIKTDSISSVTKQDIKTASRPTITREDIKTASIYDLPCSKFSHWYFYF
jgi:histone H3/H4